jgi:hypothetical protein
MARYPNGEYRIGIYGTKEVLPVDSEGLLDLIHIDDSEGRGFLTFPVLEVNADDVQIGEPSEKAGGYVKHERAQRRIFNIKLQKLKFPESMAYKRLIQKAFRNRYLFLRAYDYNDSEGIAPEGKCIQVAGRISKEDDATNGCKWLTIELKSVAPLTEALQM